MKRTLLIALFALLLPVIAARFVLVLLADAWGMGEFLGNRFSDWIDE